MIPIIIPRIPLPVSMGDVVFTWWPGKTCALTMKVTGGRAAHQEQISRDGETPVVLAASAYLNGMQEWFLDDRQAYFERTHTEWARFTPTTPFTEAQRRTLKHYFGEAEHSYNYSRGELCLQGLDALKNWITRTPYDSAKAVFFRRLGDSKKAAVICSKVVNLGLIRIEVLPEWSQYWSPADTLNKFLSSTSWQVAEATDKFFDPSVAVREKTPPAPEPLPLIMVSADPAVKVMDPRVVEVLKANGIT